MGSSTEPSDRPAGGGGHTYQKRDTTSASPDEVDPVEKMLLATGCYEHHTQLQECMFEYRDWRKCQELVQSLKLCMKRHEESKSSGKS